MPWKRGRFRDNRVYAEVDAEGRLAASGGRVTIRYSDAHGVRLYSAGAERVSLDPGAPIVDLPDGQPADDPPAGGAAVKAPGAKAKASRGSGFGKAGTRTAEQARAAAVDARQRLAELAPGTVVVFTDGSCQGNPGPAGSGAVVVLPDGRRAEASLALGEGTNNLAELVAIGLAMDLLDAAGVAPADPVVVFTDSGYANGVLAQGWKAKANQELVGALKECLRARPGVSLEWVAGHVGVAGNERADQLANQGVAGITSRRTTAPEAARSRAP